MSIKHFNRTFLPMRDEFPPKFINISDSYRILTPSQEEAYNFLKDERLRKIDAPGGWGKTTLMIALANYDVMCGYKVLITTPENHISKGFLTTNSLKSFPQIKIDDKEYDIQIQDYTNKNNVQELKRWILTPAKDLIRRSSAIAVSTHQAFVIALNQIFQESKEEFLEILPNFSHFVDEAHRIQELLVEKAEKNQLTVFCEPFIKYDGKLTLATATHFRGDRLPLHSENVKFATYKRNWAEHFVTLEIDKFDLNYQEYLGKDPIDDCIKNILKEPKEKHFVVVPSRGHKWREEDGNEQIERLVHSLENKGLRVLNLVVREEQKENKKKLLAEPKFFSEENNSKYDVVITCRLGRIGTDWVMCSRCHIMAIESSLTLAVQTLLRMMRKYSGKTNIKGYYYIEQQVELENIKNISKRDLIGNRTICLLIGFFVDAELNPIMISLSRKRKSGKNQEKVSLNEFLMENYEIEETDLIEDIVDRFEKLSFYERTKKKLLKICEEICNEVEIDEEEKEDIKNALFQRALRQIFPKLQLQPLIPIEKLRGSPLDIIEEEIKEGTSFLFGNVKSKDWKTFETIINETRKMNIEKIENRLKEFNEFVKRNGKFPDRHSKDPKEKKLAIWKDNLRKKDRKEKELTRN